MRRLLIIALLTFSVNAVHSASLYNSGAASSTFLLSSGDPGVVANYLFQDGSGTELKNNYHGAGAHSSGSLVGSAAWVVGSTDSQCGPRNPMTSVRLNNTAGTHIALASSDYVGMADVTLEFKFRATSNFTDDQLFSIFRSIGGIGEGVGIDVVNNPIGFYYLTITIHNGVTLNDWRGTADNVHLGDWNYLGVAFGSRTVVAVMGGATTRSANPIINISTATHSFRDGVSAAGIDTCYLGEARASANPFGGNLGQFRVSARTLPAAEMIRNMKRTTGGGAGD